MLESRSVTLVARYGGMVLVAALLSAAATDAAEPPGLECQSRWKALLEGEFADLTFAARNVDPAATRLRWSFTVGTETLISGHAPFKPRGPDLPTALVTIEMPDSRHEGVK